MIIFPAVDLYDGKAVRLYRGDYAQMTVYSDDPAEFARDFKLNGATHIHIVDLEGAKNGTTPNFKTVQRIISESGLFAEIGGGIRSLETIKKYVDAGAGRIILGTAAVNDEKLLNTAVEGFGEKIAVGVDISDGFVAVKGWTEKTRIDCFEFCRRLEGIGVNTIICTDISKDGAMRGTNLELYRALSVEFKLNIIASGGISTLNDLKKLREMNIFGAIIGKAYYSGAISIKEAIEVSK